MQIQSSLYDFSAALATSKLSQASNADSGSNGAGFASLLLQQNHAAPAPAPATPSATQTPSPSPAPAAPAPAEALPTAPAQTPATRVKASPAPTSARTAENAARPAEAPANDGAAEPQAAVGADTRTLLRNKLRAADSASPVDDSVAGKSDSAAADPLAAAEKTRAEAVRRNDGGVADPALNPTAANLPLPAPLPAARSAVTAADGSGKSSDASGTGLATDKSSPSSTDAAAAKRDAALPATAADASPSTRADPGDSLAGSGFSGLLAEHQAAESAGPARASAVDGSAPVANASAFAPAPTHGTAAPQTVELATPVNAPDFAQQLGVQVSVLAKDGVQHAELHLNPADMGPVSVQITLDGTQARVDFGAELATTRHAIETGLPALASALADAGFTLAGGGVSQHAGGGRGNGNSPSGGTGDGARRSAAVDATTSASTAASGVLRRTVSAGGLDLYA